MLPDFRREREQVALWLPAATLVCSRRGQLGVRMPESARKQTSAKITRNAKPVLQQRAAENSALSGLGNRALQRLVADSEEPRVTVAAAGGMGNQAVQRLVGGGQEMPVQRQPPGGSDDDERKTTAFKMANVSMADVLGDDESEDQSANQTAASATGSAQAAAATGRKPKPFDPSVNAAIARFAASTGGPGAGAAAAAGAAGGAAATGNWVHDTTLSPAEKKESWDHSILNAKASREVKEEQAQYAAELAARRREADLETRWAEMQKK